MHRTIHHATTITTILTKTTSGDAPVLPRTQNNERRHPFREFRGRSTGQRHNGREDQEGRHSRPELRGCSTRQRHDKPWPPRRRSFAPRISRKLHAPAIRQATETKRVVIRAENFEDAPRASAKMRNSYGSRQPYPVFYR